MKILLTGGAGYIGSHTATVLCKQGYDVEIVDNFSNSKVEVVERLEQLCGRKIPVHCIDVTQKEKLLSLFMENNYDGVIHFAGFKAVGESVANPLKYYQNNLNATMTLLEVMTATGVNTLVFSSSATVYHESNPIPYVEGMTTGCTNPYGWTKFMSEQIITDVAQANPNFSGILLRYFNPVGAHPSGAIGEDPQGIPNNLMPYITQVAVGKLSQLSVFGKDYPTKDGTGVRDYLHVMDLAQGHCAALEYGKEHKGCSIFNLGTGVGSSVLELVSAFERASGVEIPYAIAPRRSGDIAAYYANADKAAEQLHWKPKYGLEEMCRDSWNWQSHNPKGYQ